MGKNTTVKKSNAASKKDNEKNKTSDAENDPAESETEADVSSDAPLLTEEVLKSHICALKKRLTDSLGGAISALQEELEKKRKTADRALKLAEDNIKAIEHLKNENTHLKTRLHSIENEKIVMIEEQIENRTNRQLRKTLVFKGISENPSRSDTATSPPSK